MIKNRELALIPDSALQMLEPPGTSPVPDPRPAATSRPARTTDRPDPRHREPVAP